MLQFGSCRRADIRPTSPNRRRLTHNVTWLRYFGALQHRQRGAIATYGDLELLPELGIADIFEVAAERSGSLERRFCCDRAWRRLGRAPGWPRLHPWAPPFGRGLAVSSRSAARG